MFVGNSLTIQINSFKYFCVFADFCVCILFYFGHNIPCFIVFSRLTFDLRNWGLGCVSTHFRLIVLCLFNGRCCSKGRSYSSPEAKVHDLYPFSEAEHAVTKKLHLFPDFDYLTPIYKRTVDPELSLILS